MDADSHSLATRVFFEAFRDLPRLGPGSRRTSLRALDLAGPLPQNPQILEVGCGEGTVAILLAEATGGTVTALDLYPHLLETLRIRARDRGLEDRILPVQGDMAALPFPDRSFDLLWCEGAAYILGVDRALKEWRRVLRPGGRIALSDAVWTQDPPPEEAKAFWGREYPGMRTREDLLDLFRSEGYAALEAFDQPDEDWWEDFYAPLEQRLPPLRERYREEPEALEMLADIQGEIDLRRRWPGAYGYVFVVGRG